MLRLLQKLFAGNRAYIFALVILNLFFFSDVLFTDYTLFYRDIGNFHQPLKRLVTEAYSQGEWPLWNPYVQFGQPLLANPNSMALYPTQLLFQILPFDFAFDLNLVLHCLIGGLGAFYLSRALNLSPVAAFCAALAYNFNGVVLSFINLPLLAAIAGLLPWLALLLKKIVRGPTASNLAIASLLFGLLLLLLEPLTAYAVFLFLVPFGVYSFWTRPAGVSVRRVVAGLLIVLVSAVCLAGVQIVPTLELFQNSGREKGLSFQTISSWSVHPFSLTQMLFPGVWKDAFDLTGIQAAWSMPFSGGREPYVVSCYAGLSCLMIGLLGLFFSEKTGLKWLLIAVAVTALVLSLGNHTPLYAFLFHYVPPFRWGRYPAKYLLTTGICFSLLTGLGIDQLSRLSQLQAPARRRRLIVYFVLVGGLLLFSGLLASEWLWRQAGFPVVNSIIKLTYQGVPIDLSQSLVNHSILYLWTVLGAGLLVVIFSITGAGRRAAWMAILATVVIFFDLLTNHVINPLVRSDAYQPSPVTEWLVARTPTVQMSRVYYLPDFQSAYRILGRTDSFVWSFLFRALTAAPYTGAGHHIQYSTFMPIDRLESLASQVIDSDFRETKDFGSKLDLLANVNTGYLISMNPIGASSAELQASFELNSDRLLSIYGLKNTVPRAYVTGLDVLRCVQEGGGRRFHWSPKGPQSPPETLRHPAKITAYRACQADLSATASKPSMLVLLDSYYPGWRVWVDGREQRVELVNRAFRGVILQPGEHRVTFKYDPKSFRYGLAMTVSALVAWAATLLVVNWRRRRSKKEAMPAPEAELVWSDVSD